MEEPSFGDENNEQGTYGQPAFGREGPAPVLPDLRSKPDPESGSSSSNDFGEVDKMLRRARSASEAVAAEQQQEDDATEKEPPRIDPRGPYSARAASDASDDMDIDQIIRDRKDEREKKKKAIKADDKRRGPAGTSRKNMAAARDALKEKRKQRKQTQALILLARDAAMREAKFRVQQELNRKRKLERERTKGLKLEDYYYQDEDNDEDESSEDDEESEDDEDEKYLPQVLEKVPYPPPKFGTYRTTYPKKKKKRSQKEDWKTSKEIAPVSAREIPTKPQRESLVYYDPASLK